MAAAKPPGFFNLQPEDQIKVFSDPSDNSSVRQIFFWVGPNPAEGTQFKLTVDFEESRIFLGDLSLVDYGILCLPAYCQPEEQTVCHYRGLNFKCTPVTLQFTISLETRLTERFGTDPTPIKARVFLIQEKLAGEGCYSLVKDGVIGLSPSAEIFGATATNGEPSSLTFRVFARDKDFPRLDFEVYFNHVYSHEIQRRSSTGDRWDVAGGTLRIEGHEISGIASLNFETATYINFAGAFQFCEDQINAICHKTPDCNPSIAQLNRAQTVVFAIRNQPEIQIPPEQYLYFDVIARRFKCYFQGSSIKSELEFGLKMFERFPFSIHFEEKSRFVVLQNQFEELEVTPLETKILMFALSSGIVISILLTVWIERQHSKIKIS